METGLLCVRFQYSYGNSLALGLWDFNTYMETALLCTFNTYMNSFALCRISILIWIQLCSSFALCRILILIWIQLCSV